MVVDLNIQQQLKDPDLSEDIKKLLKFAQGRLLESKQTDNYVIGVADQPVAEYQNETVQQSFHELLPLFSFLSSFTVGEYVAFEVEYEKVKKSRTQRKRGRPKKTTDDVAKQIQQDIKQIINCYPGLRINMITRKIEYMSSTDTNNPEWTRVEGSDIQELTQDLAYNHGIFIPKERASGAFSWAAKKNPFEPTAFLMDQARAAHPDMSFEEAEKFLSTIGTRLCGTLEEEPTVKGQVLRDRFLSRFLVNVAYLARNPGETPQWLPVLIGGQGCGKSQLCRHLVPENSGLFCELTHPIEKLIKEPQLMHNGLILELPEIDEYFTKRGAIEQLKMLVTKKEDLTRFPYDKNDTMLTRRFAFIGTSNKSDIFRDGTGEGERRYLPIQIPKGFATPWREIEAGLNLKIWAAADIIASVFVKSKGENSSFFSFDPEELDIIYKWQRNYSANDPWEAALYSYISARQEFSVEEVLDKAIQIPVAHQSTHHTRRLNELIRRKFGHRLKFIQQARRGGRRLALWSWQDKPPMEDVFERSGASLDDLDSLVNPGDF